MVRVTVPVTPLSEEKVVFLKRYVNNGERVAKGAVIAEFALDKSNLIVESPADGFVRFEAEPGMSLRGGDVFAIVSEKAEAPLSTEARQPTPGSPARPAISEPVRKLMATHGLSEAQFEGFPIVTESLVMNAVATRKLARPASPPLSSRSLPASARSEAIDRAKQLQIQALLTGQSGGLETALSVEFHAEAIVAELAKRKLPESYLVAGLLRAIAVAATKEPKLTAFFSGDRIHYYDRVDLGYAMNLKSPLRIGVIRKADALSPAQMASTLMLLGAHFTSDRMTPEEQLGATLTVSSLIPLGIRSFAPLINDFQSANFGLGGDRSLPGYPIVVTVTYDHRVFDGFEIASILSEIRTYMKEAFLTELK